MPGTDCTVVAYGMALYTVMKALKPLSERGISCEVIDLRSLVPLDKDCILNSVNKAGRLVVVHEANRFCGLGAELTANGGGGGIRRPERTRQARWRATDPGTRRTHT